jgi:polyribonucleotide nucleotidyltransferase
LTHTKIETELAGRTLTLETGKWAKLADAAVLATLGGTSVLVTAQGAKAREGIDFFPLTVDYREKTYAAGKFPGGFFKREARPTNKEILTCRLIDRPLRPMFPDGFRDEVQVLCNVLVVDHDVDPDVVAMIGAFAAVWISSLPFEAPMGAIRVGYVNDKVTLMPSVQEVNSGASQLNLTMAASKDAITMVEAGANGVSEDLMLEALEAGHEGIKTIIDAVEKLAKKVGKDKLKFDAPEVRADIDKELDKKHYPALFDAVTSGGSKKERGAAVKEVSDQIVAAFEKKWAKLDDDELASSMKYLKGKLGDLKKAAERESILEGKRTDGRKHKEIRPITIETSVFDRLHGSAVFTRGETQALVA